MVLVDRGNKTNIICLGLCTAFACVLLGILGPEKEIHQFDRWSTLWMQWLDGHTQRIAANGLISK